MRYRKFCSILMVILLLAQGVPALAETTQRSQAFSLSDFATLVHDVVFADYDGTILNEQVVVDMQTAIPPEAPTREGHTFTGWRGQNGEDTTTPVIMNILFTAQYIENAPVPQTPAEEPA
ncbi:MAG: hypothetical protein Q4D04_14970, partial [Clostridia bacterium]|nr:hypothetical protein [Clostridia bacterium]